MLAVRINFSARKELNMRKEMMHRLQKGKGPEAHRWVTEPVWKGNGNTYSRKKCKQGDPWGYYRTSYMTKSMVLLLYEKLFVSSWQGLRELLEVTTDC